MECRELHRDRRLAEHAVGPCRHAARADRRERILIGRDIAICVVRGESGLAQHVEGEAVAFRFERLRDVERFRDRAAEHELLAHDAHRMLHGIADEGLARARHEPLQIAADIGCRVVAERDEAAGEHQSPGRGIDEKRIRTGRHGAPMLAADLVGDELVRRVGVGNAQQRLGKAHQHHALLGGERVFLHEGVDAALLAAPGPHRGDKLAGEFGDLRGLALIEPRLGGKRAHEGRLVRKEHGGDGAPVV